MLQLQILLKYYEVLGAPPTPTSQPPPTGSCTCRRHVWAYQSDQTHAVNMQGYKYHFQFLVYLFKTLNYLSLSVVGVIAVMLWTLWSHCSSGR